MQEKINAIEEKLKWKIVIGLYLLTRISILLILIYGSWGNTSMLCYTGDCKFWWNNVQQVINGHNPYKIWQEAGGFSAGLENRADSLPVFFLLISIFAFFWKNILAVFMAFFFFDILNIYLISKLVNFKKIATSLYILAPSILRGLFFPEDELLITFALASIYFFTKKRYSLSTIMLVLWFNVDFYPILFFPVLLMNLNILQKIKQTIIFISILVISHIPYFPDWFMVYEYRIFHWTLEKSSGGFGLWKIFPMDFYVPILIIAIFSFYLFAYSKKLELRTGYLLGSLIFLSLYPRFSTDHLITLIPLFLVWTKFKKFDIAFWIFLSMGVCIEFLGLPTIGFITQFQRELIRILILIGFYLSILTTFKQ